MTPRHLSDVQAAVCDHIEEIAQLFVPEAKITIIVRIPDHPSRDFMITGDRPEEIIGLVARRWAEGPAR